MVKNFTVKSEAKAAPNEQCNMKEHPKQEEKQALKKPATEAVKEYANSFKKEKNTKTNKPIFEFFKIHSLDILQSDFWWR